MPPNALGVTGLFNHGNTCFINACLQAIVSTDFLAEFFVKELYKEAHENLPPVTTQNYQNKRNVTRSLANLVTSVWTGCYHPDITKNLKRHVGILNHDYDGQVQHDAMEFLCWILDTLHEDLKRDKSKNDRKERQSMTKEVKEPGSIINDIFRGEYKISKYYKGTNEKHDQNRYEPFISINLPLCFKSNQHTLSNLYVNCQIQRCNPDMANVQFIVGFKMSQNSRGSTLKRCIKDSISVSSALGGLNSAANFHLIETSSSGLVRSISDDDHVHMDSPDNQILAIEYTPRYKLLTLICFTTVNFPENKKSNRLPNIVVLHVQPDINYKDLVELFLTKLCKSSSFDKSYTNCLSLHVHQENTARTVRLAEMDSRFKPLLTNLVQNTKKDQIVKFVFQFDHAKSDQFLEKIVPVHVESDSSENSHSLVAKSMQSLSILECFQASFETETFVESSKSRQVEISRQISDLPKILILQLGRFGYNGDKIHSRVDFKITNFSLESIFPDLTSKYKLYAVISHHGSLQEGHYTATCRNSHDRKWRQFDDEYVTEIGGDDIDPSRIVTKDSYLLFYQRMDTLPVNGRHWMSTTEEDYQRMGLKSASQSGFSRKDKKHQSMPARARQGRS